MKKRILILLVVVLALAATASLVWANPGLVSYWPFDEGTGTTAFDATVNDNDGAISGATWVAGKFGTALNFAASGDLVTVPNAPSLEPANVTVSAWVRNVGTPTTYDYILAKTLNGNWGSYAFYTRTSGGLFFYVSTDSAYYWSDDAGSGIWDGGWHHIAGTYDGSLVRLFVDGSEIGSANAGPPAIDYGTAFFNGDLSIGSYGNLGSGFDWRGDIDEVVIWDHALSAEEVASLASLPEVEIDIKPGSYPNSINMGAKGVIPVAILTTDTFDAGDVDPSTVELAGAEVQVRGKADKLMARLEDVDGDSDLDLVVQVVNELSLVLGDVEATLTARTYDGLPLMGTDSLRIVPPE